MLLFFEARKQKSLTCMFTRFLSGNRRNASIPHTTAIQNTTRHARLPNDESYTMFLSTRIRWQSSHEALYVCILPNKTSAYCKKHLSRQLPHKDSQRLIGVGAWFDARERKKDGTTRQGMARHDGTTREEEEGEE